MKFIPAGVLLLLIVDIRVVGAQTVPPTFEYVDVETGNSVEVVTHAGKVTRGVAYSIDRDALTMISEGSRLRFTPTETESIFRRGDSVWSGTIGGAAVGAGFIAAAGLLSGDCWSGCFVTWPAVMMLAGGIGAGVGAAVDWAITGRREVFRGYPSQSSSARWRLSPVVAHRTRAMIVSVDPFR